MTASCKEKVGDALCSFEFSLTLREIVCVGDESWFYATTTRMSNIQILHSSFHSYRYPIKLKVGTCGFSSLQYNLISFWEENNGVFSFVFPLNWEFVSGDFYCYWSLLLPEMVHSSRIKKVVYWLNNSLAHVFRPDL